ncbi:Unknown protein sequence [Pseudomonas amygdali pv. morsprunorum]|nr:Unknown protein sequence [Pseudomonas amygdali pv. morsprunorum]
MSGHSYWLAFVQKVRAKCDYSCAWLELRTDAGLLVIKLLNPLQASSKPVLAPLE